MFDRMSKLVIRVYDNFIALLKSYSNLNIDIVDENFKFSPLTLGRIGNDFVFLTPDLVALITFR